MGIYREVNGLAILHTDTTPDMSLERMRELDAEIEADWQAHWLAESLKHQAEAERRQLAKEPPAVVAKTDLEIMAAQLEKEIAAAREPQKPKRRTRAPRVTAIA